MSNNINYIYLQVIIYSIDKRCILVYNQPVNYTSSKISKEYGRRSNSPI